MWAFLIFLVAVLSFPAVDALTSTGRRVIRRCNSRCISRINAVQKFGARNLADSSSKTSLVYPKLYRSSSPCLSPKSSASSASSSSSSWRMSDELTKFIASFTIFASISMGTMPSSCYALENSKNTASSSTLEATIKQLETSNTRGEVVQSLADLFEVSGKNTLKARSKYKYRIVGAINEQRIKLTDEKVDWDEALRYESGELKRRVDPYRTVDLKGYLKVAPVVGGIAYLVALFVQQALPELFIFAYPLAAIAFIAPIVFIVVFS